MEIERITREEDFYNLKVQWDDLLFKSGLDNIFLTWEWQYTWWGAFKRKGYRLFILLAKEGKSLLGIAPLYQDIKLFIKCIRFIGDGIVCSDYLRFISLPEFRESTFRGFLDFLGRHERDWGFWLAEGIIMEKREEDIFINWCRENNYIIGQKKSIICPYIRLPSNQEQLMENLSSKFKREIRYETRRMEKIGKLEWVDYSSKNDSTLLKENFNKFVEMNQRRWKGRGFKNEGPFSNKRFLEFNNKILQIFLDKGWLSLPYLKVGDRLVAMHYNFIFQNKLFHYLPSFDLAWSKYSPGAVALFEAIRHEISRGTKIFDFLRGDENYKMRLSKTVNIEMVILVMHRTFLAFLYLNFIKLLNMLKGY
jgi:CelD/BcsL family acetyltransferase involved in cellulose biosynthesis